MNAILRPPSSAACAVPPSQHTAPVLEFRCLYTHDLRRKAKRWQDGYLRFHTFNKRIMVYDLPRNYIGDTHWHDNTGCGEVADGDEFALDRGGVLVQVAERIGTTDTDLTSLLAKKSPKKPQQVLGRRPELSGVQTPSAPPNRPSAANITRMMRPPLNEPSPYQQRQAALSAVGDGPPAKRPRNDDNHIPLWEILKTSRPSRPAPTSNAVVQVQSPLAARSPNRRDIAEVSAARPTPKPPTRHKQGKLKVKQMVDLTSTSSPTNETASPRDRNHAKIPISIPHSPLEHQQPQPSSDTVVAEESEWYTPVGKSHRRIQSEKENALRQQPVTNTRTKPRPALVTSPQQAPQPAPITQANTSAHRVSAEHSPTKTLSPQQPIDLRPSSEKQTDAPGIRHADRQTPSKTFTRNAATPRPKPGVELLLPSSPSISTTNHLPSPNVNIPTNIDTAKTVEDLVPSSPIPVRSSSSEVPLPPDDASKVMKINTSDRPKKALRMATSKPRRMLMCQQLGQSQTDTHRKLDSMVANSNADIEESSISKERPRSKERRRDLVPENTKEPSAQASEQEHDNITRSSQDRAPDHSEIPVQDVNIDLVLTDSITTVQPFSDMDDPGVAIAEHNSPKKRKAQSKSKVKKADVLLRAHAATIKLDDSPPKKRRKKADAQEAAFTGMPDPQAAFKVDEAELQPVDRPAHGDFTSARNAVLDRPGLTDAQTVSPAHDKPESTTNKTPPKRAVDQVGDDATIAGHDRQSPPKPPESHSNPTTAPCPIPSKPPAPQQQQPQPPRGVRAPFRKHNTVTGAPSAATIQQPRAPLRRVETVVGVPVERPIAPATESTSDGRERGPWTREAFDLFGGVPPERAGVHGKMGDGGVPWSYGRAEGT